MLLKKVLYLTIISVIGNGNIIASTNPSNTIIPLHLSNNEDSQYCTEFTQYDINDLYQCPIPVEKQSKPFYKLCNQVIQQPNKFDKSNNKVIQQLKKFYKSRNKVIKQFNTGNKLCNIKNDTDINSITIGNISKDCETNRTIHTIQSYIANNNNKKYALEYSSNTNFYDTLYRYNVSSGEKTNTSYHNIKWKRKKTVFIRQDNDSIRNCNNVKYNTLSHYQLKTTVMDTQHKTVVVGKLRHIDNLNAYFNTKYSNNNSTNKKYNKNNKTLYHKYALNRDPLFSTITNRPNKTKAKNVMPETRQINLQRKLNNNFCINNIENSNQSITTIDNIKSITAMNVMHRPYRKKITKYISRNKTQDSSKSVINNLYNKDKKDINRKDIVIANSTENKKFNKSSNANTGKLKNLPLLNSTINNLSENDIKNKSINKEHIYELINAEKTVTTSKNYFYNINDPKNVVRKIRNNEQLNDTNTTSKHKISYLFRLLSKYSQDYCAYNEVSKNKQYNTLHATNKATHDYNTNTLDDSFFKVYNNNQLNNIKITGTKTISKGSQSFSHGSLYSLQKNGRSDHQHDMYSDKIKVNTIYTNDNFSNGNKHIKVINVVFHNPTDRNPPKQNPGSLI